MIIANSNTKFHYDLKLELMNNLISQEDNNNLHTQDWKTEDVTLTAGNLVLLKVADNQYSVVFQIVDFVDKRKLEMYKVKDYILISFQNTGYLFKISEVLEYM